ncbi:MAG: DUF4864 domain-containing protein [Gammaproteobacteria bacterium]|nr:DUF4864 domain-containing protein [Gammaproteobacteria bacterium]
MPKLLKTTTATWLLMLTATVLATAPPVEATEPSPDLAPEEVVRMQVEWLRTNDAGDQGIAQVFAFASPANRAQTGPLDRFTAMVRSAPYAALLGHRKARFGAIAMTATQARQRVTIVTSNDETRAFLWVLSRQTDDACKGCWMTDAVIPLGQDDDADGIDASGTVT